MRTFFQNPAVTQHPYILHCGFESTHEPLIVSGKIAEWNLCFQECFRFVPLHVGFNCANTIQAYKIICIFIFLWFCLFRLPFRQKGIEGMAAMNFFHEKGFGVLKVKTNNPDVIQKRLVFTKDSFYKLCDNLPLKRINIRRYYEKSMVIRLCGCGPDTFQTMVLFILEQQVSWHRLMQLLKTQDKIGFVTSETFSD